MLPYFVSTMTVGAVRTDALRGSGHCGLQRGVVIRGLARLQRCGNSGWRALDEMLPGNDTSQLVLKATCTRAAKRELSWRRRGEPSAEAVLLPESFAL